MREREGKERGEFYNNKCVRVRRRIERAVRETNICRNVQSVLSILGSLIPRIIIRLSIRALGRNDDPPRRGAFTFRGQ